MVEIEGGGGGSVESGGNGEVSSSSEVSETSAVETGGESSEATQEAAIEESGESGGFDEDTDTTESPEDSAEDYEESDSDKESDDSQEVGFSEGNDVENADLQYDDADYENDEISSSDEDGVGFDDSDDDVNDGIDEDAESETESSDSPMDEGNNESVDETDSYDDDSSESYWDDQENDEDLGETEDYPDEESLEDSTDDVQDDGEAQTENADSNADGDEADGDMDNDGELDDAENDTESDTEDGDNIDDIQDDSEAQTEDADIDGDDTDGDIDNDGELDDAETNAEDDTEEGDNIDDVQDDGEARIEDTDFEADGDDADNNMEGDGVADDVESDTEDNDYDEDEAPGELEDYSDEESLEDSTDDAQDDSEAQTEDTGSDADGEEADGDMDNDGELDDAENDTESDTEDSDNIDYVQDDGEAQAEDTDIDGDDGDGDIDNDDELNDAETNAEDDTEDDDYDEDEDPGELEDYSDEDTDNRDDETTDDSESERDKEEEEQAIEENQEAADRAENEPQNADIENADKNVDDTAEPENRHPAEYGIEQQTESADANSTNDVDTENDASRTGENNNDEAQTDTSDNKEDNSTDNLDQTEEQPDDANAKMDNKADTPEGEDAYRTAMNNMAEYMNDHNYGRDDYAEYSQDPEWQELNATLQKAQGIESESTSADTPSHDEALANMSNYMNEHNYGRDDYAEYSQDPEWQKLNTDLQQSLSMEVTTDVSMPSPESSKDVSATELPDNCVMVNASDIDMTYAQGMDSDQFWNHHGSTKEDYMRMAERIPDVQQALDNGKSLDEIKQDPELKDTAHAYFDPENMIKVEQQADGSYFFADDGRHRIAAAQELGYEIPVEVTNKSEGFSTESNFEPNNSKEHIDGMAYTQGNNELGYEGTCGPTSVANSLDRVMGTNKFTENDMVKTAADNKLCYTTGLPENCGGTSTRNIIDLVDKVTTPEDNITTEVYEYGNALSVDELADKLKDSNTVAMVGVDSSTLWDTRGDVTSSSLFSGVDSDYSDHWIMVDKPVYGDDGKLEGFSIVDSGGGESFVDRDKFEAMYIGNDNFEVKDPTSIIISRGEPISGGVNTNIQPREAPAQKESTFIAEETDLSPPETGDTNKNADRTDVDTEIPTKDISDMPENVQHSYEEYESAGWPNIPKLPEQTLGTHASGTWQNRNGDLPRTTSDGTPITYREHDVNNKSPGSTRDAQRFVTGSDGSVYYTDDHYSTFTKLKQ